jgi:salicylate hydroxylase
VNRICLPLALRQEPSTSPISCSAGLPAPHLARMAESKPFEIAIIGGGITGLVLALALHRRHIRCTIYERAPSFGEIGAGVAVGVNAARALSLCDFVDTEDEAWFDPALADVEGHEAPGGKGVKDNGKMGPIYGTLSRCATHNTSPSHRDVWFDFLDGTASTPAQDLEPLFNLRETSGFRQSCGVHRARWLEEMVKLLPEGGAKFGKDFVSVEDVDAKDGQKLILKFKDGTTAEADAIVGCDGVNSRTRAVVLGEDHPAVKSVYTGKYVYRGLIPMDDAIKAVGEEKAQNAQLWMGPDRHVLTFVVDHGKTLNLVAMVSTDEPWPDEKRHVLPSTREKALKDFEAFGPGVLSLIKLTKEHPDIVSIPTHLPSSFAVDDADGSSGPSTTSAHIMCLPTIAIVPSLPATQPTPRHPITAQVQALGSKTLPSSPPCLPRRTCSRPLTSRLCLRCLTRVGGRDVSG